MRYASVHAAATVGVAGTIILIVMRPSSPPWHSWVWIIETMVRGLERPPHHIYVLLALAAILLVPVRAGIADAIREESPAKGTIRGQAMAAIATAMCSPMLYYGASTAMNETILQNGGFHRWNDVESLVIALWAFAAIPVTLMTSHFLQRHSRRQQFGK